MREVGAESLLMGHLARPIFFNTPKYDILVCGVTAKPALLVFRRGSMSRESRKFKVPDELADLYDFANSLDLRHFTHHGVQHVPGDQFTGTQELAARMSARGCCARATRSH